MPNSFRSSSASVCCRLEWRPSRWLLAALALVSLLAAVSILESEMPRPAAWLLAVLAFGYGVWTIRREAGRPTREFVFPGNASPVLLDGQPVEDVVVHWRGSLAFVRWREGGRVGRLAWWPDTLPTAKRRELRLAGGAGSVQPESRNRSC